MKNIENRKYVIALLFILVSFIFIGRLLYMQVVNDKWKERAAQISENKVITYPSRGIIYDRNKEKLVSNEVYYDIYVVPKQVDENIDSFAFAKLLDISIEEYSSQMQKARKHSKIKESVIVRQIPPDEFEIIAPELYKYPGFFEVGKTLRIYPKKVAAHVLGYMNQVDSGDIKNDAYYRSGDMIGRTGIERKYESLLRGKKGVKYYLQDAIGVETGRYEGGKYDTLASPGKNITISLDWELQAYGEKLMQNKLGSVVAIDPGTGEILAMISSPTYDPNLLVGRRLGANYMALSQDSLLPLYNRSTMAKYNPGSTFKLVMALVGMETGAISPDFGAPCTKSLVGCHNHPYARNVSDGVKMSCNPYFYAVGRRIIQSGKYRSFFKDAAYGLDVWKEYVLSMGIGRDLNVDFPHVETGFVPGTGYYDTVVYTPYSWAFSTIYSIAIGQGEVSATPIELANLAAVIANRGYFYYPHFIREIEDMEIPSIYRKKNKSMISPEYFEPVIDGMWRVVHEAGGTARRARVDSLNICGKTGTAENFAIYKGEFTQMVDHSIFIAFAPKDDPKIAISVYIENSGFGGTWAAPLASLMIEKYINGAVSDTTKENRIIEADLREKKPGNYKKK